jgi:hypothetical protein
VAASITRLSEVNGVWAAQTELQEEEEEQQEEQLSDTGWVPLHSVAPRSTSVRSFRIHRRDAAVVALDDGEDDKHNGDTSLHLEPEKHASILAWVRDTRT